MSQIPLNLPCISFRRAADGSVWVVISDDDENEGEVTGVNLSEFDARRLESWLRAGRQQ